MAKGKHSTALFEVINRPARRGVTPPPVVTRAPLGMGGPSVSGLSPAAQAAPSSGQAAVEVDRDRHLISLRVSYTTAAVTAFAAVVIVVLGYLVGRGSSHGPQLANASTEELRSGPANPTVMDVSPAPTPATPSRTTPRPQQPGPAAQTANTTPTGPVAAPTNVKRIIGQNYVIMQSYPDEPTAKEAQAALLAAGIPCTIDRGPEKAAPMSWYSVVGTEPFDRITKNPQLEAYVKAIEAVRFGDKSKFKKFEPRAYKWR